MYTRKQCTVTPFIPEYPETNDVFIFTGATDFDTKKIKTDLLVFGQGLWFWNRMRKSLINPNQCRAFGVMICDDYTDNYRSIGI